MAINRTGTSKAWRTRPIQGQGAPPLERPVIGLRVLPFGSCHWFDDFTKLGRRKKVLTMGASKRCDIRIEDPYVSSDHAFIYRDRRNRRVYIYDANSTNGLFINGARTTQAELFSGSVVTVGATMLVTLSSLEDATRVIIAASRLEEFVRGALRLYGGNLSAAADGIDVPRKTFEGWLENRFSRKHRDR